MSQGRIIISFGRHISILHKRKVQMPIEGFFRTANTFDEWDPSKGDFSFFLRLLTVFHPYLTRYKGKRPRIQTLLPTEQLSAWPSKASKRPSQFWIQSPIKISCALSVARSSTFLGPWSKTRETRKKTLQEKERLLAV